MGFLSGTNYGPVLVGIFFTGLFVIFVKHIIKHQIIAREQAFEIYKRNINAAEKIFEETTDLINFRLFSLQRVFWAYKYGVTSDAIQDWTTYREAVTKWNNKDMSYKARLNTYFGNIIANNFMSNRIGFKKDDSLYTRFYYAHRNILDWKSCLINNCRRKGVKVCRTDKCDKEKDNAQKSLDQLREKVNSFVDRLNFKYKNQYLKQK